MPSFPLFGGEKGTQSPPRLPGERKELQCQTMAKWRRRLAALMRGETTGTQNLRLALQGDFRFTIEFKGDGRAEGEIRGGEYGAAARTQVFRLPGVPDQARGQRPQ